MFGNVRLTGYSFCLGVEWVDLVPDDVFDESHDFLCYGTAMVEDCSGPQFCVGTSLTVGFHFFADPRIHEYSGPPVAPPCSSQCVDVSIGSFVKLVSFVSLVVRGVGVPGP